MQDFTLEQAEAGLARAIRHRDADMLLKGSYGRVNGRFRGCSIGCDHYDLTGIVDAPRIHAELSALTGVPEWLLYLRDRVFEELPEAAGASWHVEMAQALRDLRRAGPVDWQAALHRVHAAILSVALPHAGDAAPAVQRVIDLHRRPASVSDDDWSAAARAARSARSAAESAAAWSAAWSAESAAAWSAESAARSAWSDIRSAVLAALAPAEG